MFKLGNLLAIVSVTIALCCMGNVGSQPAGQETISSILKLVAQLNVAEIQPSNGVSRESLLSRFAAAPKGDIAKQFYSRMESVVNEYRINAHNFVADSKKTLGWLSKLTRNLGPLGKMRSIARNSDYLRKATERYAEAALKGPLEDEDVECDLLRYKIDGVGKLAYVLQTDINHLTLEDSAIINEAIYKQLRDANFVAKHNYYSVKNVTPAQRQLLKDFYLSRVNMDTTTTGEAVDHFEVPSSFVLGRLLDSCASLLDYMNIWRALEPQRESTCAKSKLASNRIEAPVNYYRLSDYEVTADFCGPFMKSLETSHDDDEF